MCFITVSLRFHWNRLSPRQYIGGTFQKLPWDLLYQMPSNNTYHRLVCVRDVLRKSTELGEFHRVLQGLCLVDGRFQWYLRLTDLKQATESLTI